MRGKRKTALPSRGQGSGNKRRVAASSMTGKPQDTAVLPGPSGAAPPEKEDELAPLPMPKPSAVAAEDSSSSTDSPPPQRVRPTHAERLDALGRPLVPWHRMTTLAEALATRSMQNEPGQDEEDADGDQRPVPGAESPAHDLECREEVDSDGAHATLQLHGGGEEEARRRMQAEVEYDDVRMALAYERDL